MVGLTALGPPWYGWTSQVGFFYGYGYFMGFREGDSAEALATVDQSGIRGLGTA